METMERLRVLTTGPTGFVGSNFCHFLISKGVEVHVFIRETSNIWRIKDILAGLKVHYCDLNDRERLKRLISEIKPDGVLHFAVYGGYPFQKETAKIIETNFLGTVNLLDASLDVGFKWFLNTGSSSEYGIKDKPMSEDDLLEPIDDYGVAKSAATLYCQSIAKRLNVPIFTLRLFSVYGYYEESTRLIPYLILSCLKNKEAVLSSPDSVRDFVFIEDVLDAYMRVIEKHSSLKPGEIFNVGTGVQSTVAEVATLIKEITNSKTEFKWGINEGRGSDVLKIWKADVKKISDTLGWRANYDLRKGLTKTILWFKNNLNLYMEEED